MKGTYVLRISRYKYIMFTLWFCCSSQTLIVIISKFSFYFIVLLLTNTIILADLALINFTFYLLLFLFVSILYLLSMATSTFKDFELASTQQRPDSVLRRRRRQKPAALESSTASPVVAVAQRSRARRFVRLAVMGLTVALGAAALAVVNSALEWAPKLDLFPWTTFKANTPTYVSLTKSNW